MNAAAKKALWVRIYRYQFDNLVPPQLWHHVRAQFSGSDASTRAFAGKLARKLGWSGGDALRAIQEYRKFVYLGVVSDFPVTPPKIIDQVWHEHLLFSRGYREFCREVLQHDFDHNPELVPLRAQTEVFQQQYDDTLSLYHSEFGVPAPPTVWGTPKFGKRPKPRRQVQSESASSATASDTTPLWLLFEPGAASSHHAIAEFGGGGGFAGGGGGATWGSDSPDGGGSSPGDGGSGDTGGSGGDAGSGGGDAGGGGGGGGGGDSGGSGCSSGCGGGGD